MTVKNINTLASSLPVDGMNANALNGEGVALDSDLFAALMQNQDLLALNQSGINPEVILGADQGVVAAKDSSLMTNSQVTADLAKILGQSSQAPLENQDMLLQNKINSADAKILENSNMAKSDKVLPENVISMMNMKKGQKVVGNPYALQQPKTLASQARLADSKLKTLNTIQSSEPVQTMKKFDLLMDANRAVGAIAKDQDGQSGLNGKIKSETKVLDLSKINASNTNELINQISDYIVQNATARKPKIELTVRHEELGNFKINVERAHGQQQVNIGIQTMSVEAQKFFTQSQGDILSHLSGAGVQVADFRLDHTNNQSAQDNKNNQFSGNGQQGQNHAESNNQRQDSKRREDLWNAVNKEVA